MRSSDLPSITNCTWINFFQDRKIHQIFIDSRKHFLGHESMFIAFSGSGHDGHEFIAELYDQGVRQFVVEREIEKKLFPEANILKVESSLKCLQDLATFKRKSFQFPVIGITGSNGKTIIKEWLFQVLSPDHSIIKSPGSYNSQIGVPLSVLPGESTHTLGLFEAGISKAGEVDTLEKILEPEIGLFTNLLSAHDEGFASRAEKAQEKAKLFKHSKNIVYCADDSLISEVLKNSNGFSWSLKNNGVVNITQYAGRIQVRCFENDFFISTSFSDQASLENLCHVTAVMLLLGYKPAIISERCSQLQRLPMRLEMREAINGCKIIDDSYSNDLSSLKIALDFLKAQHSGKKAVILSDLYQTGLSQEKWFTEVKNLISSSSLDAVIGIGPVLGEQANLLHASGKGFPDVTTFLNSFSFVDWHNYGILIKGARIFKLEEIVEKLQRNIHGTIMEIDLMALNRNLNFFRSRLQPDTRLMVMVKAFAYGSGAAEIARFLEHNGVHYLGVAYTDEGIAIRDRGIKVPIMVMNPAPESYGLHITHGLEPAIFSLNQLQNLINRVRGERLGIHIKLDTGMHRLGFEQDELATLVEILLKNPHLTIRSIYSHLAASENPDLDYFSHEQAKRFQDGFHFISNRLGYKPIRHLLNTAGIIRFPEYHFEMVRLGIGLYGTGSKQPELERVVTLKTVISQIKIIKSGETVGYGRLGKVKPNTKIGTIAIGYADGYSRAFGRGVGKVFINGKLAPTIGNICMDMTMIDLTDIEAKEGDEVIIYGKDLSPDDVAGWINTIPYELLTSTGDRVRRIFHSAG